MTHFRHIVHTDTPIPIIIPLSISRRSPTSITTMPQQILNNIRRAILLTIGGLPNRESRGVLPHRGAEPIDTVAGNPIGFDVVSGAGDLVTRVVGFADFNHVGCGEDLFEVADVVAGALGASVAVDAVVATGEEVGEWVCRCGVEEGEGECSLESEFVCHC